MTDTKSLLLKGYDAAVQAALPDNTLPALLPEPPKGKTYVIGAGKAAAKMAMLFEQHYKGAFEGMVITRKGQALPAEKIKIFEAAHPVPDENGPRAAREILEFARKATQDDLVICLLSGGGSALLSLPLDHIAFETYQSLNKQLLGCGAPIQHINAVRKHLTQCFGGQIALAAAPAKIITLSISDVAGDDPSVIASGPTVGDPSTQSDALDVIRQYDLKTDESVIETLQNKDYETPKPDDPVFKNSEYVLIATPQKSLEAGAAALEKEGIQTHILTSELEGDTNEAAAFHCAIIKQILQYGEPFNAPCALISGGETTVKLSGNGQGGPNTQMMLQTAILLENNPHVSALACDTDGIDGIMDNAGAYIDSSTLTRAMKNGLDPKACLENNDSYNFFEPLGDLIVPGPTHTNVNDFRVFLIK